MSVLAVESLRSPRLGFVGAGWIGRNRLAAIARSSAGTVAAFAEPSEDAASEVLSAHPGATRCSSVEELLDSELDGVVIATPSAMHAEQSIAALERGMAVFCQKPLGRNAEETRAAINAARDANRLLGVDLSYRFVEAFVRASDLVRSGDLGEIFSVDLTFHNAYGPDKPWFYDAKLSGGGCLIDLGIHLVDFSLWALDFPAVSDVSGVVFAGGERMRTRGSSVEDYAEGTIALGNGATVRIACSWRLHAGRDAVIEAAFRGTNGGATVRNVGGSFYDFVAEHHSGTATRQLAGPPDDWSGRAAVDWARRLARDPGFDPSIESLVSVAAVLDRIYDSAAGGGR